VQFYEDIPWVLAAGGSKGEVAIWDCEESEAIKSHFSANLDPNAPKEPKIELGEGEEDDKNSDFEDMDSEEKEEVVTVSKKDKKKKSKKD